MHSDAKKKVLSSCLFWKLPFKNVIHGHWHLWTHYFFFMQSETWILHSCHRPRVRPLVCKRSWYPESWLCNWRHQNNPNSPQTVLCHSIPVLLGYKPCPIFLVCLRIQLPPCAREALIMVTFPPTGKPLPVVWRFELFKPMLIHCTECSVWPMEVHLALLSFHRFDWFLSFPLSPSSFLYLFSFPLFQLLKARTKEQLAQRDSWNLVQLIS